MPDKKEFPHDPKTMDRLRYTNTRLDQINTRPFTNMELLMQEAPGKDFHVAQTPIIATLELKEILGIALESLEPEDRYIAEQLFIQGNSLRKLGMVLSIPKTSLARRRDRIRRNLMITLVESPPVRNWLRQPVHANARQTKKVKSI